MRIRNMSSTDNSGLSRRNLLVGTATSAAFAAVSKSTHAEGSREGAGAPTLLPADAPPIGQVSLNVNGVRRDLAVDTRTTLLDALREHLHLTGTKKGCD